MLVISTAEKNLTLEHPEDLFPLIWLVLILQFSSLFYDFEDLTCICGEIVAGNTAF